MSQILITGGHSGIGFEAAKTLASKYRRNIVLAGRSPERMTAAANELKKLADIEVTLLELDTSSLASVRAAAAKVRTDSFDAILCNAGGRFEKVEYSPEGYEHTFATNCLGHFLLTELLIDRVTPNGRVIFIRDPVGMAIYEVAPDGQHASKRTLYLPTPDDQARQAKLEAELTAAHNKMTAHPEAGTQASGDAKATMRRDVRGSVGAVTFSGQPFEFTTMIVEDGGTAKKEALGEQMIEGVRAEGTRETRTIPAGKIGNERPIESWNCRQAVSNETPNDCFAGMSMKYGISPAADLSTKLRTAVSPCVRAR